MQQKGTRLGSAMTLPSYLPFILLLAAVLGLWIHRTVWVSALVAAILAGRSRSGTCSIHRRRPRTGSIMDWTASRSGFGTNRSVPLPGDRKDISPLSDYVVRAVHQEALPLGARTLQKPLLRVDAEDGSVRILL